MGLDLTLLAADWQQLRTLPVKDRIGALSDAVCPPELDIAFYDTYVCAEGWLWPPNQDPPWCGEYHFACTTGSYWPHSCAGDGWDDMRHLAEASLREAMDGFLRDLIWVEDPDADPSWSGGGGFFPPATDRYGSPVLLVCPPEAVPAKARAWQRAAPRLEELCGPFAAECAGWAGRPDTFEAFTTLVREWGEVVTETARRGWGLVGLP
ncbi:hypothetical protein [Streptomyces sp. NPDC059786]|uniref:hypothetical protein n=1 Tax=Streptomyces sp. NPDC059786 TaxID=3346946 RepID=UPI00365CC731